MTIEPKHDRFEEECDIKEIGERQNFTREDIEKLNVLYDCNRRIGTIRYFNFHTEEGTKPLSILQVSNSGAQRPG